MIPPGSSIAHLDEAAARCWPSEIRVERAGLSLGLGDGFSKRANSARPLPSFSAREPHAALVAIRACEAEYAARGLPCIFQLGDPSPPGAFGLDAQLALRGYRLVDPTSVQVRDLAQAVSSSAGVEEVRIAPRPGAAWLDACCRWNDLDPAGLGRLLARIDADCAFARVDDPEGRGGDAVLAVALGVVDGEHLGLFEVTVSPASRRLGHASRVVRGLLGWGAARGARRAFLQVVASNTAARLLYARLGFEEVRRYWYRVQSPDAPVGHA